MSVLSEALEFLGLVEGSKARNVRYGSGMAKPRKEQRELAETMRRLPARYADRLPARTLEKIKGAAASGQWEKAVDRLVTALHARAEAVTTVEREELRAVLEALNMPVERVDNLVVER
jgi:DNA transposition AAA+ family ATPase